MTHIVQNKIDEIIEILRDHNTKFAYRWMYMEIDYDPKDIHKFCIHYIVNPVRLEIRVESYTSMTTIIRTEEQIVNCLEEAQKIIESELTNE